MWTIFYGTAFPNSSLEPPTHLNLVDFFGCCLVFVTPQISVLDLLDLLER